MAQEPEKLAKALADLAALASVMAKAKPAAQVSDLEKVMAAARLANASGKPVTVALALALASDIAGPPLKPAVPSVPHPGQTIAEAAQAATHVPGLQPGQWAHGFGHHAHVKTPGGEKLFHEPIGALIVAHGHGTEEHAQKAVEGGTHHYVQAGENKYAVHNDADVNVPKDVDVHNDADVAKAPKVVVGYHHGQPSHAILSPKSEGKAHVYPHSVEAEQALHENYKPLPSAGSKKPVTLQGKSAGWVPHDWDVYKPAAVKEGKEKSKWAKDPQGNWHLIANGEVTPVPGHLKGHAEASAASGHLVKEGTQPHPAVASPSHAEPAGAHVPAKVSVGGVHVTKEEIHSAIGHLSAAQSTNVKGPLKSKGHPLADMDYMAIAKEELAKHPHLKVPSGTKSKHVGQVKVAVLHHLAEKLKEFHQSDAEQDHAAAAAQKAEKAAEHAQKLTPSQATFPAATAASEPEKPALPEEAATKPVTLQGKHVADVPEDWKVYQFAGQGEKAMSKAAVDPDGKWHSITGSGVKDSPFQAMPPKMVADGKLIPDEAPGTPVGEAKAKPEVPAGKIANPAAPQDWGGVTATAEQLKQAADWLDQTKGQKSSFKGAMKAAGNPLADADYMGVAKAYAKAHPGQKTLSTKELMSAHIKELLAQATAADQEKGHAEAAHVAEAVTQGTVKPEAEGTPAGAKAEALKQAAGTGHDVYATPDGQVTSLPPAQDEIAVKATPQHELVTQAGQDVVAEATPAEVAQVVDQNITAPAAPEAVSAPDTAYFPQFSYLWEKTPGWQELHDAVLNTTAEMAQEAKKGNANAQVASALWSAALIHNDVYLWKQGGEWKTGTAIPQAAWGDGVQTYFAVTPDHQVAVFDKNGSLSSAWSPEAVKGIFTAGMADVHEKLAAAKKAAEKGEKVTNKAGDIAYHLAEGETAWTKPSFYGLYVKDAQGAWWAVNVSGEKYHPVTGQATLDSDLSSGTLQPAGGEAKKAAKAAAIPEQEPVPGTPQYGESAQPPDVTFTAHGHSHSFPAGTEVYTIGGLDIGKATEEYAKLPDGKWKVIYNNGAEQPVSDYQHYVDSGTLVKVEVAPKLAPETPSAAEEKAGPDLPATPSEVTLKLKKKTFFLPYGTQVFKNEGSSHAYLHLPSGEWKEAHDFSAYLYDAQDAAKHLYDPESGVKQDFAAVPGQAPFEPYKDEVPVLSLSGQKVIGIVPVGSAFWKSNDSGKVYIIKPDGGWNQVQGGYLSGVTVYDQPNLKAKIAKGDMVKIAPPGPPEMAHIAELFAVKKDLDKGVIDPASTDPMAYVALAAKYAGDHNHLTVWKDGVGQFHVSNYAGAIPPGSETWKVEPDFTGVHTFPDGTTEKLTFEQVKAAAAAHVKTGGVVVGSEHKNGAAQGGKFYSYGFYGNPKPTGAYLEIKAGTGHHVYDQEHKYGPAAKAVFTWHDTKGGASQITPSAAEKKLEKNTAFTADQPEFTPKAEQPPEHVTVFGSGNFFLHTAGPNAPALTVMPDGSAVNGSGGALSASDVDSLLAAGKLLDKYHTTVVKPGVQPDAFYVFGAHLTPSQVQQALEHLQENSSSHTGVASVVKGIFAHHPDGLNAANKLATEFWNDKLAGQLTWSGQAGAVMGLLHELQQVPELPADHKFGAAKAVEVKFLKSLPPGISSAKDVFTPTGQGYAKPFSGLLIPHNFLALDSPGLSDKIKAVSAEFGGGQVVGTHLSGLSKLQKQEWLAAWKKGDMAAVFNLDAAGGKVSPAHPGAPDNASTHKVTWAAWDSAQVPASKTVDGTWTDLKVAASAKEIDNYLIKAGLQHAAYLTMAQKRQWVKAHRTHDQDTVDTLSKEAWNAYHGGKQPKTPPPEWTDNVQPAKSYDVLLEDGTVAQNWHEQAVNDFWNDHQVALKPYAEQYMKEQGLYPYHDPGYWASATHYTKKYPVQKYLDAKAAAEEAEKLRPKFEFDPNDHAYVTDQFGHRYLWHAGSKAELAKRVAVTGLARAWGFRTPATTLAKIESSGEAGAITPVLETQGDLAYLPGGIAKLTDKQLGDLAREHVFDYALGNPTSDAASYVLHEGAIVGVDKGGAFTDFAWPGTDSFLMNIYVDQPLSKLFKAITSGAVTQSQADAAYIAAIRTAARMAKLNDARIESLAGSHLPAATVAQLTARRDSLLADIQQLWNGVYAVKGWTPPEVPVAALDHGLHAGFSEPDFIPHVMAAKSFGVPAFFADSGIVNGHILTWTEVSPEGDRILAGEATIRGQHLDNMVTWASTHTNDVASKLPKGYVEVGMHIKEAVKRINDQIDKGNYGTHKSIGPITGEAWNKVLKDEQDMKSNLSLAQSAVQQGEDSHAYASFTGNYGDAASYAAMAKQYLAQIQAIHDAWGSGTKMDPSDYAYWEPEGFTVSLASGATVELRDATRALGTDSSVGMDTSTWQLNKDDGELHLQSGLHYKYPGSVWRITLPTGETIEINDSVKTQTPKSQQGRLRFHAVAADGSASLERVRSFLQEMGLPLEEADDRSMENMYWRLASWSISMSADRKDAAYLKFWTSLAHQLTGKGLKESTKQYPHFTALAAGPGEKGLTHEEEAAVWRKAFATVTSGQQIADWVNAKRYLPHLWHHSIHSSDIPGGAPEWYRFDITPEQLTKQDMLIHAFSNPAQDAVFVARTGGLYSTEGRLRALATSKSGQSSVSDMSHGSSGYVFLSQNRESSGSNNYGSAGVWFSPRVLARMQNYSYATDQFGEWSSRKTSSYFGFDKFTGHSGTGNELLPHDSLTLMDDIEFLVAHSEKQRQDIIKDLKAAGVTDVRGMPVEERILTGKPTAVLMKKAKDLWKAQSKDWFSHTESEWQPAVSENIGITAADVMNGSVSGKPAKAAPVTPPVNTAQALAGAGYSASHGASTADQVAKAFPAGDAVAAKKALIYKIEKSMAADSKAQLSQLSQDAGLYASPGWSGSPEGKVLGAMVSTWAKTHNSALAVALQSTAADMFGMTQDLYKPYDVGSVGTKAAELVAKYGPVLKNFILAQYQATQDSLAEHGIQNVTVYRAFKFAALPSWAQGTHAGSVITSPASMSMASWATTESAATTAALFGTGGHTVVVKATIPAAQVLSHPGTGFGALAEKELVVLDSPGQWEVVSVG